MTNSSKALHPTPIPPRFGAASEFGLQAAECPEAFVKIGMARVYVRDVGAAHHYPL
jgi:hypothetical protein